MLTAPTPVNEMERLADLRALEILDTPPEERFDRLVQLAAHLFHVPIAYIALVDSDRQWFKARHGVELEQTPRDISFCGHAINQSETFVIPDALLDERFRDNPMVQSSPNIRFYAGHPLQGRNGHNVGTFCLADREPRDLSKAEMETLSQLAALAAHELNMHELIDTQRLLINTRKQLTRELAEAEQYVRALLPETLTEGPIRTDYRFVSSSELGGDLLGYHWLDDRQFAFYVLDVCGHGVGPALLSASVHSSLRRQTLAGAQFDHPADVLAKLNEAFPMDKHDDKFFTIWYGVYDTIDRTLTYADAGHPPALLIHGNEEPVRMHTSDFMIGVVPTMTYKTKTVSVPPGAKVYLYSDGVYEAMLPDSSMLGIDGLERVIREQSSSSDGSVGMILERIRDLQESEEFNDDFSLLELEFD